VKRKSHEECVDEDKRPYVKLKPTSEWRGGGSSSSSTTPVPPAAFNNSGSSSTAAEEMGLLSGIDPYSPHFFHLQHQRYWSLSMLKDMVHLFKAFFSHQQCCQTPGFSYI
jgi:hypothetical protein